MLMMSDILLWLEIHYFIKENNLIEWEELRELNTKSIWYNQKYYIHIEKKTERIYAQIYSNISGLFLFFIFVLHCTRIFK